MFYTGADDTVIFIEQ